MSDCVECGKCYWTGCQNDAAHTLRDVTVKRHHSYLFVGDIDLCDGHHIYTRGIGNGHLNLDWTRIEQVLAQ